MKNGKQGSGKAGKRKPQGRGKVISLAHWLAERSMKKFAELESLISALDEKLAWLSPKDPEWITLTAEQSILSYLIINYVLNNCGELLPEPDRAELAAIRSDIEIEIKELARAHPDTYALVTADLAENAEKQQIFVKLLSNENEETGVN